MELSYLQALGYSEKEIADYSKSWAQDIIEYLAENSDYVFKNMRYLQDDFSKDLLLKLPVFYPDTFAISPIRFKEKMTMLKNAFPDEWKKIIEQQFWAYSGIAESTYEPILEVFGSNDDSALEKAIEQLKNPDTITFEFLVELSKEVGINVSPNDILCDETYLWFLEESKNEIVTNAKYLIGKGLSKDTVEQIICSTPDLMMLPRLEVEAKLEEGFGENYITSMEDMELDTFYEKLNELL